MRLICIIFYQNYARELLQLFSLGLYQLNDAGTIQVGSDGHEIRTYRNHDISEYAKVFVGFAKQAKRGNVEDVSSSEYDRNEIDPLQIFAEKKDHFPKVGPMLSVSKRNKFCICLTLCTTLFPTAWHEQ